ncbi:MAG: metal ABC transporter permease [Spirochaetales bacterium]|nr:metal ABC transporter permease [Spirochaetales bacterium]
MISDFLSSFDLFLFTYLSGWILALLLSVAGIVVVGRSQIFMSLALGQSSAAGITLVLFLNEWLGPLHLHAWTDLIAVGAATLAVVLMAPRGRESTRGTDTGSAFLFIAAGSVTLLLARYVSHGMEEVQKLMISTLLASNLYDLLVYTAAFASILLFFSLSGRRIFLILFDETAARAQGLPVDRYYLVLHLIVGLCIGLAISKAGLLFTFACLVLPAFIARNLFLSLVAFCLALPFIATFAIWPGFFLAHSFDHAPGQMIAFVLSVFFVFSTLVRRFIQRA